MAGVDFSKEEMQRVIDAGHPDYFIKSGENHYEVKTKNGICPYFSEDKACMIHEVRPAMCRVWPVYPECKKMDKEVVY